MFCVIDIDGDGTVDIMEFEAVLDDIYDELFVSGRKGGGRAVGEHYKRQNTIDHNAMNDRRERHELIEQDEIPNQHWSERLPFPNPSGLRLLLH